MQLITLSTVNWALNTIENSTAIFNLNADFPQGIPENVYFRVERN